MVCINRTITMIQLVQGFMSDLRERILSRKNLRVVHLRIPTYPDNIEPYSDTPLNEGWRSSDGYRMGCDLFKVIRAQRIRPDAFNVLKVDVPVAGMAQMLDNRTSENVLFGFEDDENVQYSENMQLCA